MSHVTLVLLVLACRPHPAAAEEQPARVQEPADILAGARIRVSTRTVNERVGLVARVTADALEIRLDGDSIPWTVPFVELTSVETSQGLRSRAAGAWGKAKWGALIGAIPGAISLGLQHEQVGENGSSVGGAMALGAWSGGLVGGLIGAAIGAIHPGEKWKRVFPTFRIHPIEVGGGVSFAATVEF